MRQLFVTRGDTMRFNFFFVSLIAVGLICFSLANAQAPTRITILYDAFGKSSTLKMDWGFSVLVESNGKRILFDTGNNAEIFAHNVKALGIDLTKLDFVVISHRHGDHTSGLNYLLSVNPNVPIYAPRETFGVFGASIPPAFYRKMESSPPEMRYFAGKTPDHLSSGSPWPSGKFIWIDSLTQVGEGFFLVSTVSQIPGTLELRELSLSIRTPKGQVIVCGCSHPGIERIVDASRPIDARIHLVAGGFHLVSTPDSTVERIATALREKWNVDLIAPGHCTGEPAFAIFQKVFGKKYLYAGLGSVLEIP
jgi:7,8-dihydropterin-6-yl-methyl-4-(beta-D-ribofuranosyl)aminobenzene 5'-phosphate synthase